MQTPPPSPRRQPQPAQLERGSPRFRFSTKTMLLALTLASLALGVCAVLPNPLVQAVIGAFWLAASGCLVTGLVFAKGDRKAFCIGATVVVASTWFGIGARFLDGVIETVALLLNPIGISFGDFWPKQVLLVLSAAANGLICVRARRHLEERDV
ncbi:MAG: hypothetical protein AAGA92_13635 [Planctomycetota bacterium]